MASFEAYELRSIPEILELRPSARDYVYVCDAGGLASKVQDGDLSIYDECPGGAAGFRRMLREGDLSMVAESDVIMDQLRETVPVSRTWQNTCNVAGSLPIVPAVLAGHPLSMRVRSRLKLPAGPLSIFLETTGSGGAHSGSDARGAVMLALVRMLSEYRAVDLHVCTTYGGRDTMNALLCKVETTPLDLARASHLLGRLGASAIVGDRVMRRFGRPGYYSGWSYGVPELERRWCGEIFRRFLNPGSDVLFVPAAYLDDNWRNPVKWLKDMLVRYGGETIEEDAA